MDYRIVVMTMFFVISVSSDNDQGLPLGEEKIFGRHFIAAGLYCDLLFDCFDILLVYSSCKVWN